MPATATQMHPRATDRLLAAVTSQSRLPPTVTCQVVTLLSVVFDVPARLLHCRSMPTHRHPPPAPPAAPAVEPANPVGRLPRRWPILRSFPARTCEPDAPGPAGQGPEAAAASPFEGRLLGQLAGALSRELDEPLTALLNEADSADLMLRRGELAEARARVGQMRLLGERMAELLAQLVEQAWLPGARLERTDVRKSLELALQALGIVEGRHANGVAVHLAGVPEPAIVLAEPALLERVFVNLLHQAVQAAAQIGRSGRVEVFILREGGKVHVTVGDNGPWLGAAASSHLGLGLAIARRIVEQLGGELRAYDRGGGADGAAVYAWWLPWAGDALGG
jgi:signal transduction histidine kinase